MTATAQTAIVVADVICEMCGKKLKSPGNAKLIFFGYTGYYFCQSDYKKIMKFALKRKGLEEI